ncbi:DUF2523 family protein [Vibrio sinaloensis]|uniref:DUF2523 family protein n=1 Tax=Photobacterium sp. (strain ATCC 43367) TaxID=379097 RepID=UPI00057F8346|nr:DUF2523 family protein [Vibrio sinaloensis]KHT38045.1 hypothetical protein RJ46_18765 [Vibrio sinaloensis]
MPYVLAFFASVVLPLIPSIVRGIATYAAVSLGFSLVAYKGASAVIDTLLDYIQSNVDGVTADVAMILALAGADKFINIVVTCGVFAMTIRGLMAASGYKPSWRKPQMVE